MAGPHDKIIANCAKSELGPIGFRRKGQSRTWIADHEWWVIVVEFQPSAWSKGCYLNVATHWLWSDRDYLSFDFGGRLEEHVEYLSDTQFSTEMQQLAQRAAQEAERLREIFATLPSAASILIFEALKENSKAWPAFHAGVAAALAGRIEDAQEMLSRVANNSFQPASDLAQLARKMALLDDPECFQEEVLKLIQAHRTILRLTPLPAKPF